MKISESEVSLFSSHSKKHEITEQENLTKWNREEDAPLRFRMDRVELSDKFMNMNEVDKSSSDIQESSLDPKLQAIVRALEALTGKKLNLSFLNKFTAKDVEVSLPKEQAPELQERVGWGIDYSYEKREIREESLNFSASGNVKTEDGKDIDFSLAFNMQSRSETYESFSFKAGDALIDPLILNFDSATVNITDVKHEFDLDLDGKSDEFSFVGSGSGFLAIDKNKDGIINDGSELFGPKSGNGFNELRAYDSDGNNWIDENDDVFEQLLIWTKDENGDENLFGLSDKNVGAMYLGAVSTSFDLRANNELQGQLKESSIYLKEDGGVGTLQEIDLVV